jgi:hypothetical protein
MVDDP